MTAGQAGPGLVATDLDGTLVRSDGTVSARTRAALAATERAGTSVVFVTARPHRWLADVSALVGAHGLAICANGAILYDVARQRVVTATPLTVDSVIEVVEALRDGLPGTTFACENDAGFAREPEYRERHPLPSGVPTGRIETLLDPLPAKLLARNETLDPDEFILRARAIVGARVEVHVSGATGLLEIAARGVTKAAALADWCAGHDIVAADVWAFGDMPNDIPMLVWAGTSFAVANAHREVLAVASHSCASNDDDGVAAVLEMSLGGWSPGDVAGTAPD